MVDIFYFHLRVIFIIIINQFKTSLSFNQKISWLAYLQKSPIQKNGVCKTECKADCNSPASTYSAFWILQHVIVLLVSKDSLVIC